MSGAAAKGYGDAVGEEDGWEAMVAWGWWSSGDGAVVYEVVDFYTMGLEFGDVLR